MPEPPTYDLSPVLSADDAARFLGVHKTTVYAAIKAGEFPGRRIGKRYVVLRDALLSWLRSNTGAVAQRKGQRS